MRPLPKAAEAGVYLPAWQGVGDSDSAAAASKACDGDHATNGDGCRCGFGEIERDSIRGREGVQRIDLGGTGAG